jgi:hypothetical protein
LKDKNTKICNVCFEEKELSEFYSENKTRKNGEKYIYYRPDCKICTSSDAIKWRKENVERYKVSKKKYYHKTDKPKLIQHSKRRRENGEYGKWQRSNPEKLKIYGSLHSDHDITKLQWIKCKQYFNDSCAYCALDEVTHGKLYNQQLHKDHAQHDGSDGLDNCLPSCRTCNTSKHTSSIENWYNENNPIFDIKRLQKIERWLTEDHKNWI